VSSNKIAVLRVYIIQGHWFGVGGHLIQDFLERQATMKFLMGIALVSLALSQSAVFAGETPAKAGAKVFFDGLTDGDTVKSPFVVKFGVEGMTVAPAGTEGEFSGHHHLLIDVPALGKGEDGADEFNNNIIKDEQHLHFGKGQTEAEVTLPPGKHTLQMVFGDKDHIPHNPVLATKVITVTVQ
jgi:Domain of unknown function (DUF4399)